MFLFPVSPDFLLLACWVLNETRHCTRRSVVERIWELFCSSIPKPRHSHQECPRTQWPLNSPAILLTFLSLESFCLFSCLHIPTSISTYLPIGKTDSTCIFFQSGSAACLIFSISQTHSWSHLETRVTSENVLTQCQIPTWDWLWHYKPPVNAKSHIWCRSNCWTV